MEEKSWRRNHGGEFVDEESWGNTRRNHKWKIVKER